MDVDSTSLIYDVCNISAGGCTGTTTTTTSSTMSTGMIPTDLLDQTIIIVIAVLASIIGIALVIVGIICWKRKQNQLPSKARNIGMLLCPSFVFICNI